MYPTQMNDIHKNDCKTPMQAIEEDTQKSLRIRRINMAKCPHYEKPLRDSVETLPKY